MASKEHPNKPMSTRLPPPALFQGPPSRNTSNISLPSALLPGASAAAIGSPNTHASRPNPPFPLLHQPSFRGVPHLQPDRFNQTNLDDPSSTLDPASAGATGVPLAPRHSPLSREASIRRLNTTETEQDRADALWAEMQSTLAEVELSAVNGTHVFGAEHAHALEELRTSQLALAQAWARSEADEVIESSLQGQRQQGADGAAGGKPPVGGADVVGKNSNLLHKDAGGTGGLSGGAGRSLEEETEWDIMLARKRREANDRYFSRVNSGVLDVVGRLEEVAEKMRRVEKESRSIWSESESGSMSGTTRETQSGAETRMRSGTLESQKSQKSQKSAGTAGTGVGTGGG